MTFSVLIDTCILVPSLQRDLLLETASQGAFRPLWSNVILEELELTLRKLWLKRGFKKQEAEAYTSHLHHAMTKHFPDALIELENSVLNTFDLPDPDDAHVVAAAIRGRADQILTRNLRDFPPSSLPDGLEVIGPDHFFLDLLSLNPHMMVAALKEISQRTGRFAKRLTVPELLTLLSDDCPQFVETMHNYIWATTPIDI